jgi:hypothetical protein
MIYVNIDENCLLVVLSESCIDVMFKLLESWIISDHVIVLFLLLLGGLLRLRLWLGLRLGLDLFLYRLGRGLLAFCSCCGMNGLFSLIHSNFNRFFL